MRQKCLQSGSTMIEVVAVLGMVGVLIPVLYRQISLRNQELTNVNLATEIRNVKEAFATFIQNKGDKLTCSLSADVALCNEENLWKQVSAFVPEVYNTYEQPIDANGNATGSVVLSDSTVNRYDLYLFGRALYENVDDPEKITGKDFYGVIVPKETTFPTGKWNFKRAAHIAELIGVDGGVLQGDDYVGTLGTWQLSNGAETAIPARDPTYVAFTGFTPVVHFPDVANEIAHKNLHAWNYFSVGAGDTSCFTQDEYGNYKITHQDCQPLFWVGAAPQEGETGTEGHVYVRNDLHIGHNMITVPDPDNADQSIEKIVSTVVVQNDAESDESRAVMVYDTTGTERVKINAKGQMLVKDSSGREVVKVDATEDDTGSRGQINVANYDQDGNAESMVVGADGIVSSKSFTDTQGEEGYDKYKLDPAYTSVLNDIKLGTRGGARLSDILPTYVLKSVQEITTVANCSGTNNCITADITLPDCPKGYQPAIVVNPTHTAGADTLDEFDIETAAEGSTHVTVNNATYTRKTLGVLIDGSKKATATEETPAENQKWTVSMGYVATPGASSFSDIHVQGIGATVQVYCVFNPNAIPSENKDSVYRNPATS